MDCDVIVVGGGPAGLAAASNLSAAGHSVLLLEKESFGGWPMNLEWVTNYPSQGERTAGQVLAARMIDDAREQGVQLHQGDVTEIENYSRAKAVTCMDGRTYTCNALIIATGLRPKPLSVPGEARFQGKGVIHCAACDAGLYAGRVIAVCGGGRAGVVEALLLARHASKVVVFEAQGDLTAPPALSQRARANPVIEIRCFQQAIEVHGDQQVTALEVLDLTTGSKELLSVDGVLAHIGFEPVTELLAGTVALNDGRFVIVTEQCATDVAGIFAIGDVRHDAARSVVSAVKDAASVAASVGQYLEELKQRK